MPASCPKIPQTTDAENVLGEEVVDMEWHVAPINGIVNKWFSLGTKEELRHFTKMVLKQYRNASINRINWTILSYLRQFCPIVPRISSLVLGRKKEKLVVASVDLVVADCLLNHWDLYKLHTNFETTKWCSDDATPKKNR